MLNYEADALFVLASCDSHGHSCVLCRFFVFPPFAASTITRISISGPEFAYPCRWNDLPRARVKSAADYKHAAVLVTCLSALYRVPTEVRVNAERMTMGHFHTVSLRVRLSCRAWRQRIQYSTGLNIVVTAFLNHILVEPEKYVLNLKVVLKWKDIYMIYTENIKVMLPMGHLKIEGITGY